MNDTSTSTTSFPVVTVTQDFLNALNALTDFALRGGGLQALPAVRAISAVVSNAIADAAPLVAPSATVLAEAQVSPVDTVAADAAPAVPDAPQDEPTIPEVLQ